MTSQPYYDPEVRAFLESQPALGTVNGETLEAARTSRLMRNEEVELSDEVERVDHFVPGVMEMMCGFEFTVQKARRNCRLPFTGLMVGDMCWGVLSKTMRDLIVGVKGLG